MRLATGGRVAVNAQDYMVVRSLSDVSMSINHGDRIGLIGHNGAGKSTLLRVLAGIYEPTNGHAIINGHISSMFDIMQGMESECSGNENIVMRGIMLGLTHKQIKEQQQDIAALTGLGDYLSMPVRTYSNGMKLRLGFAISTSVTPDILLIDEVFGVGDTDFIKKATERMTSLLNKSSIVVIANHSDGLIRDCCNKALLLNGGEIQFFGSVEDAYAIYYDQNTASDS
ncbi:MAG: ATP-binding cassette domain-containing protein [Gammaproteobacteria bacterium]|nr:ATP-binding cassette domain-containing protein [Gammaproteobacteria bacterium]